MPQAEAKVDLAGRLQELIGFLDQPLNEALKHFNPDNYMKQQLAGYLERWGPKTLREFVEGVLILGHGDEPDVMNGDMAPYNMLAVLQLLGKSF